MIIDYSTLRPPMTALKAAGVTAVGRYLGWDSVPGWPSIGKNLLKPEAEMLRKAGVAIFLAFEYQPDAALKGHQQGVDDGNLATHQLAALGAPAGMTVFFALDFDIRDYAPGSKDPKAKLGPAAAYFEAINALKPSYKVGVYGGYYAVSRVLDAGLASMAWQTVAWSGGQWDQRAVIRQELGAPLAGADLDQARVHTVHGADFGQWPRPSAPKPAPAPGPVEHTTAGQMSLASLAHQHHVLPLAIVAETLRHPPVQPAVEGYLDDVLSGTVPAAPHMPAGLRLWLP